jgi:hypothetical protein
MEAERGRARSLGARCSAALAQLGSATELSQAMACLGELELCGRLSAACATAVLQVRAAPTLLALLRSASSSSSAHAQLARRALALLRHCVAAGQESRLQAARRAKRAAASSSTGSSAGSSSAALPLLQPLPNAHARALCSREAVSTLLLLMERHRQQLPIVRPALGLLSSLLSASPAAAAAVAQGSALSVLSALRSGYARAEGALKRAKAAAPALAQLAALQPPAQEPAAAAAAAGGLLTDLQTRAQRAELQRAALAAVNLEAGSEGFSLEGTLRDLDAMLRLLRSSAAQAAAAAAAQQQQQCSVSWATDAPHGAHTHTHSI